MAVIAIIQTAISIAQMFSSGSEKGIGELLQKQVAMLQAISKQLAAIQQGIIQILNSLEEVKVLIGEIPKEVVLETQRAEIAGLLTVYSQRMETYFADEQEQGVKFAQDNNVVQIERDVIAPLNKSVAIILPYYASGMVPIVCAAAYVHSEAMILANYRKHVTTPILRMYENWLNAMIKLLSAEIEEKERSIVELRKKVQLDDTYDCKLLAAATSRQPPTTVRATFKTVHAKTEYEDPEQQIQEASSEMIMKGMLPAELRPVKAVLKTVDISGPMYASMMGAAVTPQGKSREWFTAMAHNECSSAETTKRQIVESTAPELYEASLQLMSRRALNYAAKTTLVSIGELQAKIAKYQD